MRNTAEIREQMRAARRALGDEAQRSAARAVYAHVTALDAYQDARCVMAYMACRGELSLDAVMDDVLASGRMLVLPRCETPGVMTARCVRRMGQLARGAYGLMEPADGCEIIDPLQIDLILVPGTAFDRQGHRIGQGGGYYDRYLPKTQARTIGVCHDFALLERLPSAGHDYKMDMIITPSGVIKAREEHG